jgi:predicted phosphohydrolase
MSKNPIRKMHVGWENSWSGEVRTASPKSVREWVAVCPKCKVIVRAKQTYYYGRSAKKSRKLAKDALYYHTSTFHRNKLAGPGGSLIQRQVPTGVHRLLISLASSREVMT